MAVSRPDTPESPVEFTFPSATGTGDIYARAFLPKDPPAAVLVICAGVFGVFFGKGGEKK